ncbi:plasminogen-like [Ruditapes philippinarum]|uniref:plasminogen-like n=1 Tax=Ruditapes philippinarum TaxID=129788 RepID=UPI00295A5AF4|nr:plasminogen-like [Ruditapes philippinarum]
MNPLGDTKVWCDNAWVESNLIKLFIGRTEDVLIRCQKLNGHLAEITSPGEDQFLKHHIETLDRQNSRECFSASSKQYSGTTTTTYDGHTCQRWGSQTPHKHTRTQPIRFPERSVTDAANYCRDPDGLGLPWCYTTDPKIRKQYCGIYECPGRNYWAGMAILEDVWKWIHTETELGQGYTNWHRSQIWEYCGALISDVNYQWKRRVCSHTAMYICEQLKYT